MGNCTSNAKLLRDGIAKTGKFNILSKDVGVPLVTFSLKDATKYTVFQISENLRRFGWIVPAYTLPPDVEYIAVLRVVVREDLNRSLVERLVSDIERVVEELEGLPPGASVEATGVKQNITETQKEILSYWKRISDKKYNGVC